MMKKIAEQAEMPDQKMSFNMPGELHLRFKLASVRAGKTMRELMLEMVEQWLDEEEREQQQRGIINE